MGRCSTWQSGRWGGSCNRQADGGSEVLCGQGLAGETTLRCERSPVVGGLEVREKVGGWVLVGLVDTPLAWAVVEALSKLEALADELKDEGEQGVTGRYTKAERRGIRRGRSSRRSR